MSPALGSYDQQHTHQLPSPVVGHGTPCMTPEPLGPFGPIPAPIRACHPERIHGWPTSLWPQPHCPCPCMCMWRIIHHRPAMSPVSTSASAVTSPNQPRCPRPPVRRSRDLLI